MKKTWIYILVIVVVVIVLIIALSKSEAPKQPEGEGVVPEGQIEEMSERATSSISLTEMTPVEGYQGYGVLGINQSVGGNKLMVGGVEYEKGLGTHAISEYKYSIDGNYSYFETDAGLDDGADCGGNVAVFAIKGDGEELYRSETVETKQTAIHIRVSVSGVQELSLITEDGGDSIDCDHTDWLNPVLIP